MAKTIVRYFGVDFGIGDRFATHSDGTIIQNPRFFRTDAKKLARAQRQFSRKKKGSNNRAKAAMKVAKVHYRVACRRQDFLHKYTTDLVKNHAVIVIEDLNLAGMSRGKGYQLGKSVLDAAIGEARRQLEYKTNWYGSTLHVVDRFYPSSKTCSSCGEINALLSLKERVWACGCGVTHDRDINAAINLAGSSPVAACGEEGSGRQVTGDETGLDEARRDIGAFAKVFMNGP